MIPKTIREMGVGPVRTPIFVKNLNRRALKKISGIGQGYEAIDIYYINKEISAGCESAIRKAGASLNNVNFHLFPNEYFNCEGELCAASSTLIKSPAFQKLLQSSQDCFDVGADHLTAGVQKSLVYIISDDFKLFFLAKKLGMFERAIFLVAEIEILSILFPDCRMLKEGGSFKRMCFTFGIFTLMLFKILFHRGRRLKQGIKQAILFDPSYDFVNGANPEFKAFYRYFKDRDDVTYICRRGKTGVRSFLESEARPIAIVSWGVRGLGNKLKQLLKTLSLARIVILAGIGWSLKCAIAKTKLKEMYFSSLFETLKPKIYLQVRSDLDPAHPIATGIIEKHGGINVGYMTGSYFIQTQHFYTIDFHIYGLLGTYFKDQVYRSVWPENICYILAGSITSETAGHDREKEPRFAVSMATTSFGNDIWMQEDDYKECIESFFYAVSGMKGEMALREKDPRGELVETFVRSCADRYSVNFTLSTPWDVTEEGIHSSYSDEFIMDSGIIVIMGTSTMGWEALGLLKKFVIFGQKGIPHPFEDIEPRLVVRTREDLRERLNWLSTMPEVEYRTMVKPLLDRMCKESTGNMVEKFIGEALSLRERGVV